MSTGRAHTKEMGKEVSTAMDLEKYGHLKEYIGAGEFDLKKLLRMVDAILEEVESYYNMRLNPELCLNIRDQAVRIRSTLSSRLAAIEDLHTILCDLGVDVPKENAFFKTDNKQKQQTEDFDQEAGKENCSKRS